jgi:deoxyribodipyrimidine photo-lyase
MGEVDLVAAGLYPERIRYLNNSRPRQGDYVLYWMQASQRVSYNHALEYAVYWANELNLPLVTWFGLTDDFPEANARHYHFMLEGLREVSNGLAERGIKMCVTREKPHEGVVRLGENAALTVTDRGYLRIQREWRRQAAERLRCPLIEVESDIVVPVEQASTKEEYTAATLRPKIKRLLYKYLVPLKQAVPVNKSMDLQLSSIDVSGPDDVMAGLKIDHSVQKSGYYRGGQREASRRLDLFLAKLDRYPQERNDPNLPALSDLSPYLHFGQISPLQVALQVLETDSSGSDAFIEELVTRRELAINFVYFNPRYDTFASLPDWPKKSLIEHSRDRRPYLYTVEEFEQAATHDLYWNAAQVEMVKTGKMHGYMRMYWGKKILEWSSSPEEAYKTAVYLNNKYELDGRDANGYAGVAWCFGKHDRPWATRQVFGNVRYMSKDGLTRKFDADKYVERQYSRKT